MSGTTSDVGRLLVRIEATTAQLRGQLNAAQGDIDKFTKSTQQKLSGFERAFQSVGQNALKSITGIAAGVIAVSTVTRALTDMVRVADQAAQSSARIGSAIGDMRSGREVFDTIARSAQRTGTSANDAVDAFLRFSIATRQIGGTREQTLQLVDTMQKLAVVSGTSGQAGGAAMAQLGQALASGRLQGDELRSILENMPTLAEGLARQLNVSVGALRQMGTEGKLTSETVFAAILRMAPEINRQFAEMPVSVERATTSLSQAWDNLVTQLDRALDVTGKIARATQGAADVVQRLADATAPLPLEEQLRRATEALDALRRSAATPLSMGGAVSDSVMETTARAVTAALADQIAEREEVVAVLARQVDAERELAAHLAANEALTAALQAQENRRQQTLNQVRAAQEALGGTNDKTREQMDALRVVIAAGVDAMARYGISAQTATGMLTALETRADSVRQTIASLDAQTAQAGGGIAARIDAALRQAAPGGNTALLQPEQIEAVTAAVRRQGEAAAAAALQQVTAETAVARARATGGEAAGRRAQVEAQVAAAVRDGATEAQAAALRTQLLAQAGYAAAGASAGRLQPMAQVLRGLQEEARSAEAAAQAATQGAAAQRVASQADKARAEALKVARDGTEAYNRAYGTFLALVQRAGRGEAQSDIAERTRGLQADIALIERETQLIGALPGHREAEMAALRVRNELLASGRDYTEEEIRGVEALVRTRETAAQAQREIEDRLRQIRQTSEEISRDVATVLFESMTNGDKGESVVDWFKALFRRIAIQALQANIILPITQQIVGAVPGLFGIGGAATSTSGSMVGLGGASSSGGLLGQIQSLGSLSGLAGGSGSGGLLGGVGNFTSGILGTQLWGGTNAALASMGAGVYGPATPAAVSAAGGATIGGLLTGVGGGYMLGSTVGGYVAGNSPARQQNSQLGAAGGAAAGAIIGSVIPGVGTVIGGLVGGVIGGAGGGLIGPGKGFSGGDVGIAVDQGGYLSIGRTGGKNWNSADAVKEVQTYLNSVNDMLKSLGITLNGLQGAQLGWQGFGQSKNVFGPSELFAATRNNLTGSNPTMQALLNQPFIRSWEDIQKTAGFAVNDNPTLRRILESGGARSVDDVGVAAEFANLFDTMNKIVKPTTQLAEGLRAIGAQFDPVLQKAREYGLETSTIEENRRKAIEETLKPLLDANTTTNAYKTAMKALGDEYRAAIKAAAELGLATADLSEAFGRAQRALLESSRKQFDATMREALDRGYISQFIGLRDNYNATADAARSIGRNPDNLLIAQMRQVARALNDAQLDQVIRALAGVDDLAVRVAQEQKAALEAERQKTAQVEEQLALAQRMTAAMQQGGNIRQWINAQRAGSGAGLSPQMALTAAQSAFGEDLALARSGDLDALGRIANSADTLLRSGQAMYGTGPQGAALREMVLSSLENLPAVQSYDQQILAALRDLGGGVNVEVAIETVRVIQETLNLLPQADRDQLVQAQTILRTIQERMGRFLTNAEQAQLIKAAQVDRRVSQWLKRDLTNAERAALLQAENVLRNVQQQIGRNLTVAERRSIYAADDVTRTISQIIGRNLTPAEEASMYRAQDVLRTIEQQIGRNLTPAERQSVVESASVLRSVEQQIGRHLTPAEKAGLVTAGAVIRSVQQQLGRQLTAAEKALIVQPGTIARNVAQTIRAPTGNSLVPGGNVVRNVRQNVETTETIQISRSIDQKLGAALNTLNYTVQKHLPYLTRMPDVQQSLYLMREIMRGQWGGVRVTTQKASGAANGPGFDRFVLQGDQWVRVTDSGVGSSGASLTVNALGNAFVAGQVIPFAKGGLPEMANAPTYAPLALFGEAGPEAILPLQRGRGGKLGVTASGMGMGEVVEALHRYSKQSAMETMALRDELRGVRAEVEDLGAAQRRANAA